MFFGIIFLEMNLLLIDCIKIIISLGNLLTVKDNVINKHKIIKRQFSWNTIKCNQTSISHFNMYRI